MKKIFQLDKGMTQAISHFSRYEDANKTVGENGRYIYTGERKVTAEDKIKSFYRNTTRFLWIAAIALLVITNVASVTKSLSTTAKVPIEKTELPPNEGNQ